MKNKIIIIFAILFSLQSKICNCQDLETKLLHLLQKNDISEVYANLKLIKRKFPNQPIPYYVEAFLEKDARKAIVLYQNIINRFPSSNYAISAQYKIAQYYFVDESYKSALEDIDNIIDHHTKFKNLEDAYFLKFRCLLAINDNLGMQETYKRIIKRYPKSMYKRMIIADLKKFADSSNDQPEQTNLINRFETSSSIYTIQIGAYKNREYARKQIEIFTNDGYTAEMSSKFINNELFFLVWIGNYPNKQRALNSAKRIKEKYGFTYQIIKK